MFDCDNHDLSPKFNDVFFRPKSTLNLYSCFTHTTQRITTLEQHMNTHSIT